MSKEKNHKVPRKPKTTSAVSFHFIAAEDQGLWLGKNVDVCL